MEELIRVLEKTVSSLQADQNEAVKFIQDYMLRDASGFLKALSDVLSNRDNLPVVRAAAGLQLKNQLTSRDETLRHQQQERWRNLPDYDREYIKKRVLDTLGTEVFRPSSAPQCVAYIAIVELPENKWPDLIDKLTNNVINPQNAVPVQLASLEAIGYICAEIDQACLHVNDSNKILSAIVIHGMKETQTDDVKLAATTALLNSLEFTETNFRIETERDHIMQAVCNATRTTNPSICVAALECLVKIMSLYYQYMEKYMVGGLFAITTAAMQSENDDIALQGIEFWSNVCDEEIQLASEEAELRESGQQPTEQVSKSYALQALPTLAPILVAMLARQDETDETDDWKPCKSAGVCLMLLANCCENAIVGHVLPYITQNLHSDDWRRRDAAVMTFGSILDGPDQATLQPIAVDILPFLIKFMRDPSVLVRDSAAWAIGKLCDIVPEALISQTQLLNTLAQALGENLDREPRVACNVCWAINSLVTAAGDAARELIPADKHPETFLLSAYYPLFIEGLIRTTERQDNKDQEQNLRSAACEALMSVIKATPIDCYNMLFPSTFNLLFQRIHNLNEIIQRPDIREVRAQLQEFLSLLWTTLASCIRRMEKVHTIDISDNIMQALLITLNNSLDSGPTQEDLFLFIPALLEAVGNYFGRYIEALKPFLIVALSNSAVPQLNITVIGLLGDLSRVLGQDIIIHCQDFMQVLLTKLKDEHYDKNAKAQILSVFGDFALAFGPQFEQWVDTCLDMLHQASQIQPADRNDYELVDYCLKLRECAVEGYTGIVQGMKDKDGRVNTVLQSKIYPRVSQMIKFIEKLAKDPDTTDALLCACCGLIGDIGESFGSSVPQLNSDIVKEMLTKGKSSKSKKTSQISNWALNVVKRVTRNT